MSTKKTKAEHVVPENRFPVLKNPFGFKKRTEKDGGFWSENGFSGGFPGGFLVMNFIKTALSTV